jgi:hypothetical protein
MGALAAFDHWPVSSDHGIEGLEQVDRAPRLSEQGELVLVKDRFVDHGPSERLPRDAGTLASHSGVVAAGRLQVSPHAVAVGGVLMI